LGQEEEDDEQIVDDKEANNLNQGTKIGFEARR
jgi:hypothetical protein